MAVTYGNLYLELRNILRKEGVSSASLEAREIVAHAAGKDKQQFYRDMQLYASDLIVQQAHWLLKRRLDGEPVAYIIGQWDFYGMTFELNNQVLIPRADTEVLAQKALAFVKNIPGRCRVMDLCCGSGCIGIAIAQNAQNCTVVLGDKSESALRVTKQNIRRYELGFRAVAVEVDAKKPPLANLGQFDIIVSNPPYITRNEMETLDPMVKDHEPHIALCGGDDGLDFYRSISEKWRPALKSGGVLMFECGAGQADAVADIMEKASYRILQTVKDTAGIPRVVTGCLI